MRMEFCSDPLWNRTLSWDTDNPNLTLCMRNTILPAIPSGFLWILAPYWILRVICYKSKIVPYYSTIRGRLTFLFCSKLFFNILIFVNILCDGAHRWSSNVEMLSQSDFFYIGLMSMTTILTIFILIIEKIHFVRSSTLLSIFWPLMLIASLPTFKVDIEKMMTEDFTLKELLLVVTFAPAIFLLTLLNIWPDKRDRRPKTGMYLAPESNAGFISSIFMTWIDDLIFRGDLTQEELPENPQKINVEKSVKKFLHYYEKEKSGGITMPIIKAFGGRLAWATLIGLLHCVLLFVSPQILKVLINFVDEKNEVESWKGYAFATLLFINQFLATIALNNSELHLRICAINIRNSLVSAIFRKSLRLSNKARNEFSSGEINNYVSVDVAIFFENVPYLVVFLTTPIQLILSFWFIYLEVGVAVFSSLLVILLLIPFNLVSMKLDQILQTDLLEAKDKRISKMNEFLSGVKLLKLYAWELPFMKKISKIRNKEIRSIKCVAIQWSFFELFNFATPVLIAIVIFTTYVLIDPVHNILTAEKVFVSLSLITMLKYPLGFYPVLIKDLVKQRISSERIRSFLKAEEMPENSFGKTAKTENAIEIIDASFEWDKKGFALKKINLEIAKGSLTVIVGPVGSGKSSLISAILGEMKKTRGSINCSSRIAYVPQIAWIQNLTLKENVLFGKHSDPKRYQQVVDACALRPDFNTLPAKDETEIGEKGITLSGGQKQRVSLARSVYADYEIVVMDDPLSAVDVHVAGHLFREVLSNETGLMKTKTKILSTHNLEILPNADHIIVLNQGQIQAQGSFEELSKEDKKLSFLFQNQGNLQNRRNSQKQSEDSNCSKTTNEEEESGKLIEDEEVVGGRGKISIYKYYIKTIGYWTMAGIILMFASQQILLSGSNIWLKKWSDKSVANQTMSSGQDYKPYLAVYAGLGFGSALIQFIMTTTLYLYGAKASKVIHDKLFHKITKSPMSFFDTTPLGRILNRFSSDINVLDSKLPYEFSGLFWSFMELVAIIFIIGSTTPFFLIAMLPLIFLFCLLQSFYIPASRQLQGLESVSKSPIFSHLGETLNGVSSIRVYGEEERFIETNDDILNANSKPLYLLNVSKCWIEMRLEILGNLISFFAAIFVVYSRDELTMGAAGLSLCYSISIVLALKELLNKICELENNSVALERILEYCNLEEEAPWEQSTDLWDKPWPNQGRVTFRNFMTRYRVGLEPVLTGLNLEIGGSEKIGICGRTGAGKSSLTLSLFRIIEPMSGIIQIDGQDISKIGLHTLRSNLTIIPQDPILFRGSVRFNLDPLDQYSDAEIWSVLELSHLKDYIIDKGGLDYLITEGGGNFSVGQRQLVCLARALLRKTRILILDEATASIDIQTDRLIQYTIKSQFAKSTVLIVAHRLETILDCDRIAVLSNGKILEIGRPEVLLQQENSAFRNLAKFSGFGKH